MDNIQRMSVKITKELHKKLKEEANARALTLNGLVINILEEYYKSK